MAFSRLTNTEVRRLRRRRTGRSQAAEADARGIAQQRLSEQERGAEGKSPTHLLLRDLTPGEQCWVLRNRKGITQAEAARYFGVSRYTIIKWEHDAGGNVSTYRRWLKQ